MVSLTLSSLTTPQENTSIPLSSKAEKKEPVEAVRGNKPKQPGTIISSGWHPGKKAWDHAVGLGMGKREVEQFVRYNLKTRYRARYWDGMFIKWCDKIHQNRKEQAAQPTQTPMGEFGGSLIGRKLGMWETVW
jgi:hypothetical protein